MKRLAAALVCLVIAAPALAATYSGGGVGTPSISGSSEIAVQIDYRSFGQTGTATEGTPGTLNVKYGAPIMVWATNSTYNGTAVNDTGWVPEVYFYWNWDHTNLGSVTRGGVSMDLGRAIGLVASTAFVPTSFPDTCNGGSGSLHEVTLQVVVVDAGVRKSDSALLNVCVENKATTWAAPRAYCDDSDCADDAGVPAGTVHGGNLTDLATIIRKGDVDNASYLILLEGGTTFTTASDSLSIGEQRVVIESYGTGKAKLKFTSTNGGNVATDANHANCAGFTFNNVTFAGSGGAPILFGAGVADTGCFAVVNSNVSETAGEQFEALALNDPGPPQPNGVARELYFIKFDYTKTDSTIPVTFLYSDYTAFVGGQILDANSNKDAEHNLRMPQWKYLVIDAMKFTGQQYCRQTNSSQECSQEGGQGAKEVITLRQDCGGTTSCPNSPFAGYFAITRSEVWAWNNGVVNTGGGPGTGRFSGATPIAIGTAGSGSSEQTKVYDGDIIGNSFGYENDEASQDFFVNLIGGGSAGSEIARIRGFLNGLDMSAMSGSVSRMFGTAGMSADLALIGNVLVSQSASHTTDRVIAPTGSSILDVAKNNVCWENGGANCNAFTGIVEDATNISINSSTDPFNGAACSGAPGTYASFLMSQLCIGSGSALENVGAIAPYTVDVRDGSACDSQYDAGLDCLP